MIYKTTTTKPIQSLDRSLIAGGAWLRSIDTQVSSFVSPTGNDAVTKDPSFQKHQNPSDIPTWTYPMSAATQYKGNALQGKKWYHRLGISIPSWHTSLDWRDSLAGLAHNSKLHLSASQGNVATLSYAPSDLARHSLGKNTANAKSHSFPSLQFPEGLGQFWATSYQLSTALAVLLPIAVNVIQAPNIPNLLTLLSLPTNSGTTNSESVDLGLAKTGLATKSVSPKVSNIQSVKAPSPVRPSFSKPTGRISNIQSYALPAKGEFTSAFGMRWGRMHKGIDIAGPVGTPILAAAGGKVLTAGWAYDGFGNKVEIQHPDGTITLYAHTSRVLTQVGATVHQGQQIAEMGSTGSSTGPHLHFQIHPGGKDAVDPLFFFARNKMLASAKPDL